MTAWILYLDPRHTGSFFNDDISAVRMHCERETQARDFWVTMWRIRPLLVKKGLLPPV